MTVQTVIRRFGGRDGLFAAALERESGRVRDQRDTAPVGDVAGAVRVLLDHYDEYGDKVLTLLALENRSAALPGPPLARAGCCTGHGASRVFAPRSPWPARGRGRGAWPSSSPSPTSTPGSCCAGMPACPGTNVALALRELLDPLTGGRLMARILVYTSPARGHLFPMMALALELKSRGHEVSVRTLAADVDLVRRQGLRPQPSTRASRRSPVTTGRPRTRGRR